MFVPMPSAFAATDLLPGDKLYPGQSLTTGAYSFKVRTGENVVLRWSGQAMWATGTQGVAITYLIMQSDGNLVLDKTTPGSAWNSGTNGQPVQYFRLFSDGNVGIVKNSSGTLSWQTSSGFGPIGLHPNESGFTYYYEPNVPTNIRNGWESARVNDVDPTDMSTAVASSDSESVDYRIRYVSQTQYPDLVNIYARTGCISGYQIGADRCDKDESRINSSLTHPDYAALGCHETGHALSFPDQTGTNGSFQVGEQSCMRSTPDVHKYSSRAVNLVNSYY